MGWGMSSIIKHRKEKTQDRMTYKSHYKKPKEFLLIEHTHTGRVGTKKGRVMALVWRSAASECVPRQVSTLHDGTIMTDIILPSGILNGDRCCCTVKPLGFFVVFVNYGVDFWEKESRMILSSTKTRARSCTECVYNFPAPSLQHISKRPAAFWWEYSSFEQEWC